MTLTDAQMTAILGAYTDPAADGAAINTLRDGGLAPTVLNVTMDNTHATFTPTGPLTPPLELSRAGLDEVRREQAADAEAFRDAAAPILADADRAAARRDLLTNDDNWRGPAATPPPAAADDRCRKCGEPLQGRWGWLGEHPGRCPYVEGAAGPLPPGPVVRLGPEPPSTLAILRPALIEHEASRPRSVQTDLGPSQLAVPCDRRLAYALAGRRETADGTVKWAAMQGTQIHLLAAEVMAEENTRLGRERFLLEQRVWADDRTYGHCDAYDTDTDTVIDWKLCGVTRLKLYRSKGPGPQYVGQGHLYGRGWARLGRPVKWIRLVFLARTNSFDDSFEWTAPYDEAAALAVLARRDRINAALRVADDKPQVWESVDWAGIGEMAGDDCKWCPFYRRGGPADATGCPGDVEADARKLDRVKDGLIPST